MVMSSRITPQHYVEKGRQVAREGDRVEGGALDQSGIAMRCLLSRRASIDQRNASPAKREMQRDACPDDTAAEDDRIRFHVQTPVVIWPPSRQRVGAQATR